MIVYIAGPMTGIEDYNRPAFAEAAKSVSANGDTPINPGLLPTTLRPESYMPICLAMIDAADAICMLPGWEKSKGATVEYMYAKRQGKKAFSFPIRDCFDTQDSFAENLRALKDAMAVSP